MDDKWASRYDEHINLLNNILSKNEGDPLVKNLLNQVSVANNKLIALERSAFSSVQAGDQLAALDLLNSTEYQSYKLQYLMSVQRSKEEMLSEASEELTENYRSKAKVLAISMLSLYLMFIYLWVYFIRFIQENDKNLESLARQDELSGLYNRRVFVEILREEFNRCSRSGDILMLAIIDIDNFKLFNDTYGHPKGDEIIRTFGEVLNSLTRRSSDSSFRLGGEEFAIISCIKEEEEGKDILKKLKETFENLAIPHEKNSPHGIVTASIGASFSSAISNDQNAKNLYEIADSYLYTAKDSGKNCIQF